MNKVKLPGGREISREQVRDFLCASFQEQTVVQLIYQEGRSLEETAGLLGTSIEWVERLHQKALERLDRVVNANSGFNLKQFLMELGNKLVFTRKFSPPSQHPDQIQKYIAANQHSTDLILLLTEWLNQTPEAREVLEEMGISFPVVTRKPF